MTKMTGNHHHVKIVDILGPSQQAEATRRQNAVTLGKILLFMKKLMYDQQLCS